METLSAEKKQIIFANKISTIVCAVIFVFSLSVALAIDSVVLLLDSSAWMIGILTGILYDKVLKTIERPPSVRYHFGYAKFEPLSLTIEAVLIIGSCLFTLKMGVQDIIHPDEVTGYGFAMLLTFSTGIIGLLVAGYLRLIARKFNSPILKTNALSWFVDSIFSFGVFVGFAVANFLSNIGQKDMAAYADPVMGIVLALTLLPAPVKMLKEYVGELLDENPGGAEEKRINDLAEDFKNRWGMRDIKCLRIRKAGSKYFIDVCFIADSQQHIEEIVKSVKDLETAVQQLFKESEVGVRFEIA
jgi:cation diffusion facilitator family transporter